MPERIMYVQLRSGYDGDRGPPWITRVRFTRTWHTAYVHGRTLERLTGTAYSNFDANFCDVEIGERFWVSGPKSDRTDGRYSSQQPEIDADVREQYEAFLQGQPLPGRENG